MKSTIKLEFLKSGVETFTTKSGQKTLTFLEGLVPCLEYGRESVQIVKVYVPETYDTKKLKRLDSVCIDVDCRTTSTGKLSIAYWAVAGSL